MNLDIISDVHGCYYELLELVKKLGYAEGGDGVFRHPDGRHMAFVGDIVDRGKYNMLSLAFAYNQFINNDDYWVQGNHCNKFFRCIAGNNVKVGNGLQATLDEMKDYWPLDMSPEEAGRMLLAEVPFVLEFDGLTIVHAAPPSNFTPPLSKAKRALCLYGHTTGRYVDGFPERLDWTEKYNGKNFVVYGHMGLQDVYWNNNTVCIDTSCFSGGHLTALRWPEKEIVQVKAYEKYCER